MLAYVTALFLSAGLAGPAHAQLAGSVSASSTEMFRGETISRNDPVLSAAVSIDGPGGLFAGASTSIAVGNGDPRISYASQYAGVAWRTGQTSIEAGIIHRSYDRVVDIEYRRDFVEGYVGLTHRGLKARIYTSPNYLRDGRTTYYGEVNARLFALGQWSLDGHVGLTLLPPDRGPGSTGMRDYQDWRVQVSRPVGEVFVSAGVGGTNYPVYSTSGNARAFGSISYVF